MYQKQSTGLDSCLHGVITRKQKSLKGRKDWSRSTQEYLRALSWARSCSYINDRPEQLVSQVRLFADDTAVYLIIEGADSGKVLQNDLNSLSAWESRWDMELNPSKCQIVWNTTSRRPINNRYHLHGQVLGWSPVLGTWGGHL